MYITELGDGLVNVFHTEEYHRPDSNQMIELTIALLLKYDIRFDNSCRIFVDGANPSFIRALKAGVGEDTEYEAQIARWKLDNGANIISLKWLTDNMFVVPIHFNKEHRNMLAHTKQLMEYGGGQLPLIRVILN